MLRTAKAAAAETHLLEADEGLDALHLINVEITQALRFVSRGKLSEARAARALDARTQIPLRRHAHTTLLPRLWLWRNNSSACDAVYVALAEALDAPLVTCDARLGKAAGSLVDIKVV